MNIHSKQSAKALLYDTSTDPKVIIKNAQHICYNPTVHYTLNGLLKRVTVLAGVNRKISSALAWELIHELTIILGSKLGVEEKIKYLLIPNLCC